MRTRFTNAFVDQLAKLSATSLAAGLASLIVLSAVSVASLPIRAWIPIVAVALVVVVLISRIALRRLFVIYPRLDGDVEFLSKHLVYKLELAGDRRTVIFRRRYSVRALKRIDHIIESYLWTGTDTSLPTVIGGTVTVGQVADDVIWRTVELRLPRTFERGEEFGYELEWRLDDTDRASRTFFSAPINEATRRLVFDLYLPEEIKVSEVLVDERRSIDSPTAFSYHTLQLRDGHAHWDKENPSKFFYYCMRWREPDAAPLVNLNAPASTAIDR